MIPRADYHVHTNFCDGAADPETMVRAALAQGMEAIGFSGHSHTAFDESWCMSREGTLAYRAEIARLKETYGDRIRILCGVEQDMFSDADTAGYDYVIGSVHYLCCGGEYVPVDESPEHLRAAAKAHFGGDLCALAAAYYETVSRVWDVTHCDVIGHFDLIEKFNEGGALFDSGDARIAKARSAAADQLAACGVPFEINTGAIARGYRTEPYPGAELRTYLAARGVRFLLSGDAHRPEGLCFQFDAWDELPGLCYVDAPRGGHSILCPHAKA